MGRYLSLEPKEIVLYYGGVILLGLLLFLRRRPRRGIRLKLRGGAHEKITPGLAVNSPSDLPMSPSTVSAERDLNVVFNYNGETWDAYEVLGIPAGSPFERVEEMYREGLTRVDSTSHAFLRAAYQAIETQRRAG